MKSYVYIYKSFSFESSSCVTFLQRPLSLGIHGVPGLAFQVLPTKKNAVQIGISRMVFLFTSILGSFVCWFLLEYPLVYGCLWQWIQKDSGIVMIDQWIQGSCRKICPKFAGPFGQQRNVLKAPHSTARITMMQGRGKKCCTRWKFGGKRTSHGKIRVWTIQGDAGFLQLFLPSTVGFNVKLVGGLEHQSYFPISWE